MTQAMQLVRPDALEPDVPAGHWGMLSRFIERGEGLDVQVCEMAADGGAEPHVHDAQNQMFVVLEGTLTVRGGGDRIDVRAGEALRIPAGATHATVNGGSETTRYLVLTYPGSAARQEPPIKPRGGTIGE
jgi:mannose-6-phosphate isomerase-like protein (cupin superfamily)